MTEATTSIGVVGGGPLGLGFAVAVIAEGHRVVLFEADDVRRREVVDGVMSRLRRVAAHGGCSDSLSDTISRLRVAGSVGELAEECSYVQECISENVDVKRAVFRELDDLLAPDIPIASSTSSLTAEEIAQLLPGRHRCLVAHPINPPFAIRLVEVSAAPFTDDAIVAATMNALQTVGFEPVRIRVPVEGLVFNRLQGAVLREAYRLVGHGVIDAVDLDRVMHRALGRRWSIIGPFATAHLNTRGGLMAHADRLGPAYRRMGAEHGDVDPWPEQLIEQIAAEIGEQFPLGSWDESVAWRDEMLLEISRIRDQDAKDR